MKRRTRLAALLLAVSLTVGMGVVSAAEGDADENTSAFPAGPAVVVDKDEVIYARLSSGGEARDVYVVNHFTLAQGGRFFDNGDYTAVVNLTDLQPVGLSGGTVEIQTACENFYYQGYLSGTELPWRYRLDYRLDGEEILTEALAGRTGRLEIRLTSGKNPAVDDVFYTHYMQQITITLDMNKCADIQAAGATVANAGKNRVLTFTVLPGGDAELLVTADVADFEMAGVEIAAMPFSMGFDLTGAGGLLGDFALLSDAVADLSEGAGQLKDGAADLASGAQELKKGTADFHEGIAQVNANAPQLTGASAQIRTALSQLAAALDGEGSAGSAELVQLPGALGQLADGIKQVSGGMKQLGEGVGQAYAALDAAMEAVPAYMITESQMKSLYAKVDDSEKELLGQLMESYAAALTVKGTYAQIKTAFEAVAPTLESLSTSLDTLAGTLGMLSEQLQAALSEDMAGQMALLAEGLAEMAGQYASFHSGLTAYIDGIAELAGGYAALDAGMGEMSDGMAELSGGMRALYDGADRLATETAALPDRVEREMESLIGASGEDFEAVSFLSGQNDGVSFVQFVLKTEGIEKPAPEKNASAEEEEQGFWARFVRLFRG